MTTLLCEQPPMGIALRIHHAPGFPCQTDINTPIDLSLINEVIPVRTPNQLSRDLKIDEVFDCTTQYKLKEKVLTRIGKLTIDLEPDPYTLTGLFSMALGAPGPTGAFNMLGPKDFCLPLTTFVVGFDDDDDPGVIFKSAGVNNINLSVNDSDRITVRVELVGSGDFQPAVGFSPQDCDDFDPIYMQDGVFLIDGQSYLTADDPNHTTRALDYTFNNNMMLGDNPFLMGALDIKRLLRGLRRDSYLRWRTEGRWLDPVSMMSYNREYHSWTWRIGPAPNSLTLSCAHGLFKEEPPTFVGEASASALNTNIECIRVPGNPATPISGVGMTPAYSGDYAQ